MLCDIVTVMWFVRVEWILKKALTFWIMWSHHGMPRVEVDWFVEKEICWACSFSAYFLGVDALHAACLQPACRASTPVCRASTPGCRASTLCTRRRRRECARVFQWRRLHLKRNAGCMQDVDAKKITPRMNLHPPCRLHACCCNLQPPAYDRLQAACRLHAACMQSACISSVALA